MVSSPSLNAVDTNASCWSAERVARARQVEGPPSTAPAPVPHMPVEAPPSAWLEAPPSAALAGEPAVDPQQPQNAVASWEARASVVLGGASPEVPVLHPSGNAKRKRSAGDAALRQP